MKIQYLGWSAFLFTLDSGRKIVIDPYLKGDTERGVPAAPVKRQDLYPVDAVVVTHASHDHVGEAFEIAIESDAMLCASVDVRLAALDAGVPEDQIALLVSGVRYTTEDWNLKALAAQHISFTAFDDRFLTGQPLSYVLEADGVRVFHGGDTSISSDLELFGRLYQPHVALLGVGGVLFRGHQDFVELEPAEAAVAAQMLGVRLAVPMHFRPATPAADDFLAALKAIAPMIEGRRLEPGQIIHYPALVLDAD